MHTSLSLWRVRKAAAQRSPSSLRRKSHIFLRHLILEEAGWPLAQGRDGSISADVAPCKALTGKCCALVSVRRQRRTKGRQTQASILWREALLSFIHSVPQEILASVAAKEARDHVTQAYLLRFGLFSFPFSLSFLHCLSLPFLSLLFPSSFPASFLSSFPFNLFYFPLSF